LAEEKSLHSLLETTKRLRAVSAPMALATAAQAAASQWIRLLADGYCLMADVLEGEA